MKIFTIKEAVTYGWTKTKEHFWFVVGVTFISGFLSSLLRGYGNHQGMQRDADPFVFVVQLVGVVISVILTIGMINIFLKLYNNESTDFADLYKHYRLFWKFLVTHIVYGIIVMVGLILLIVPGIIFSLKYIFALMLVVDKGMWTIPALKESSRITKGHLWELFLLGLVLCAINILGFIALFVGLLVTIPVTMFASVYVYRKLLDAGNATVVAQPAAASAPTV